MPSKMNITFVSKPDFLGSGFNMSHEDSLPSYVQIQGLPVPVQLPNNTGGIMDNSSLFTYELGSISPCHWIEGSNITCNFTVRDNGSSNNQDAEEPYYTIFELVILAILAGGTCVMTIIGNLIVILSFVIDRTIRQPTNYFILSLAVSDLIIGTFSMPFYTVYLLMGKKWPLGGMLCDIWLSLDYTVCLTSIYTVFCITIDRFCMVSIPAKYRTWRTERKVNTIVAILWVIPAGLFFTSIIGWQYFVGERTVPAGKCYVQYMEDALFNCVLQIGYFWVTLTVMCILYAGIYKVALGLQKKKAAKQKKMTSLVSMAGQTMTKIGIGMSKQEAVVNQVNKNGKPKISKPHLSPGQARGGSGNASLSGSGSSRNKPDEERSSSPAYPSDTDPSSQSPKPTGPGGKCEDKPCTASSANSSKARTETSNCISNNVSATPQYGSTHPNELPTEAILDLPDFPTGDEISDSQISSNLNGNYFQFPDPVTTTTSVVESGPASTTEVPTQPPPAYESLGEVADCFDHPLPPPPAAVDLQCLSATTTTEPSPPQTGAHGNNRHHRKSQSNENFAFSRETDDLKVDVAILPLRGPDSPIWKKRESFVQREKSASQHFDSVDDSTSAAATPKAVETPQSVHIQKIKRTKHSSLRSRRSLDEVIDDDDGGSSQMDTAIHVEPLERNCKSAGKAAKVDEIQPLKGGEDGFSHKRKRSRGKGSPLKNIVQGISSRRSKRGKKNSDKDKAKEKADKAKSRSENRARKALRTITIILGAFVLCWTPWHFLAMIIGFCPEGHTCVPDVLYDISYWLCYLNSPINPFCYAFVNQQFKKTFLRILKLDWHRT